MGSYDLPKVIAASALAISVFGCTPTVPSDGDSQWIFRSAADGHRPVDLAIFMSWDFSAVLIRAWCDPGKKLVMQYGIDDAIPNDNQFQMAIILDQQSHLMETTTIGLGRVLEGRIDLTPTLSSSILTARNVDVDVPNEMGEPLYTGSAYPLKRIIEGCQS
jgi:hypothetical protein